VRRKHASRKERERTRNNAHTRPNAEPKLLIIFEMDEHGCMKKGTGHGLMAPLLVRMKSWNCWLSPNNWGRRAEVWCLWRTAHRGSGTG